MALEEPPYVRVEQVIHAGVEIRIFDSSVTIYHTRGGATFRLDPQSGEITTD